MTAGRSGAAASTVLKWSLCAATEVPRDRMRGISISPFAPTFCAWVACCAASLVFTAPVPTTTGTPASTRRSTPSIRSASVRSGQSPIDPQYTTALMPSEISFLPMRTSASKSGLRSSVQGVIRAGMQPEKIVRVIWFSIIETAHRFKAMLRR